MWGLCRVAVVITVECMFDESLPDVASLAEADDAAVAAAVRGWAAAESAACARKQAWMAEMFVRRTGLADAADREAWWVDPVAAVGAELGAAQNISGGMALAQAYRGVALRDRLPRVAELFFAGQVSDLVVRAIVARTALVQDAEAMALVDAELAARAVRIGPLSAKKTEQAIDAVVERFDPGAVRRSRASSRCRGCSSVIRLMSRGRCRCGRGCMPLTGWRSSSGWRRWRGRCVRTTRAPLMSGVLMRSERWLRGCGCWRVAAGRRTARLLARRRSRATW
jgi:hypothetical protein